MPAIPEGYSPKVSETGTFWPAFRDHTVKLRDLHICRVENEVTTGYPDVEGCWATKAFHMELKTCARPKKPTTNLALDHLTREQCMWLRRRVSVGGKAFVLVKVGSRLDARMYLVPGGNRPFLIAKGVTEERLAQLSLCEPEADYEQILTTAVTWKPPVPLGSR